ncbi:GntR family transcriptional regulator [Brevibacterium sp. FAM 27836]|uniref:GntR family transcriptional regulator n=1 Tax=Brevibacterium sp. FAM 27836 TaxID=3446693 RepID=UPI003F510E61
MSSPAMGPIDKRTTTLAERAYDRIATALLSGEIRPGERLVMDQLAERLDISRTPVRDALRRLAGEGLVEPSSNRGYIVRQVSDKDVDELYEAREAIESFAARRVAEIGTLAIDEVRAKIVSLRKLVPADAEEAFRANLAIHRSFVAATGNPMLLNMFDDVWQRARGQSLFADFVAHDTEKISVFDRHIDLVSALEVGPDAAFVAMRRHIADGKNVHLS